jgi:hypothetical protein
MARMACDRRTPVGALRLRAACAAVLAVVLAWVPAVRADVYTWVDANGVMNVSNLPPPDGVPVTKVDRPPVAPAARSEVYPQQVAALSDRVLQLEDELRWARQPAPPVVLVAPPVQYVPVPVAGVAAAAEAPVAPAIAGDAFETWFAGTAGVALLAPATIVVQQLASPRRPDRRPRKHAPPLHPPNELPFPAPRPLIR